ncbi:MAG: response regulator transcription factor [Clostridia bacterium]|nr:response regulator transcription factor [Clostridia bacterium]
MNLTKILLVEDDKSIVSKLTEFLTQEGFEIKSASGQTDALTFLEKEKFDLVLLDVSLSDGNGFSVCSAVKSDYGIPVIFLTASSDEFSTVTGFDLGADDYISKPFRPRELVSRIKNILRLTGASGSIIQVGNVLVDMVRGTASKDGKDLFLSALEYRLLLIFLNNRGVVLSRTQLLESIWDIAGDFVNDNTLTVYIKRLREKIEDDPQCPVIIKTVRGLGYRID